MISMKTTISTIILFLCACGADSSTSDETSKKNLDGTNSAIGAQGLQGDTGTQGPEGPQGPKGEQGLQGVQGEPGPQGIPGTAAAIGATGPQGPVGAAGTQGPMGPQGPQGPAGAQGTPGIPGPAGADGGLAADSIYAATASNEFTGTSVNPVVGVQVACNAGDTLISGGCILTQISGAAANLSGNFPSASLQSWTCNVTKPGTSDITILARAICFAQN